MSDKFDQTPGNRQRARAPDHSVTILPKCPRVSVLFYSRLRRVSHLIMKLQDICPEEENLSRNSKMMPNKLLKIWNLQKMIHPMILVKYILIIELKCAVLNSYNNILDKRAYRKEFILSRNLIDFKKVL
jgi:hypothetical protein